MPQTETVVRQALKEKVKPVLFINKVDRLINELQVTPDDMQQRFMETIAKVNKVAFPDAFIHFVSLGLSQGIALQISVGKKYASLQLLQYLNHNSPCFAFCQYTSDSP